MTLCLTDPERVPSKASPPVLDHIPSAIKVPAQPLDLIRTDEGRRALLDIGILGNL